MSNFINTHFIDEFKSGVEHLSQQVGSRLRGAVRVEGINSERASFDQLGLTAMAPRLGRHADTVYTDTPHARRWVIPSPYSVADLVDVADRLRVLNDPTNEYTKSFGMAAGRNIDDVIVDAFAAAATIGENGAGSQPYDTGMDVVVGGAGLTVDKLLEAKENLDNAEEMDGERYLVCASRQFRDLLSLVEITSADFNKDKALVSGRVADFLGFTIIRSERLPTTSATIRDCFYWQKSAMLLGELQGSSASIDRLPAKQNSMQVLYQHDIGATRMRETGVGRIFCQE